MTEREKELTEQVEQLTALVNELLQKLDAAYENRGTGGALK